VAGRARLVNGRAPGHCTAGTERFIELTSQLDPLLGAGHPRSDRMGVKPFGRSSP
jgi:hypothetical protein